MLQLQASPAPQGFCGSERLRGAGTWDREGCSSLPSPLPALPLLLCSDKADRRLQLQAAAGKERAAHTAPRRGGSQPHPLGCLGGERRHPNDLATRKSPSQGLQKLGTGVLLFPGLACPQQPGHPGASLPRSQQGLRRPRAGVGNPEKGDGHCALPFCSFTSEYWALKPASETSRPRSVSLQQLAC